MYQINVSQQYQGHYCIFGIHAHGGTCFQNAADTKDLALIEARRLSHLGWHRVDVYLDGKPIHTIAA